MSDDRLSAETLGTLDQVVRALARRHRLSSDIVDDLRQTVVVKLLEDDCAALRKFEGRSSIRSYLAVVVTNCYLDDRVKSWGKWRPCRNARRAGPIGILLDRLLTRDRRSFDEACELLQTNHAVAMSRDELYALAESFPDRSGRRFVDEELLSVMPSRDPGPDAAVSANLPPEVVVRIDRALEAAVLELSAEDCLILDKHYCDGEPLSRIARLLSLGQKPLYPRRERLMEQLRAALAAYSFTSEQIASLVDSSSIDLKSLLKEAIGRKFRGGPSK